MWDTIFEYLVSCTVVEPSRAGRRCCMEVCIACGCCGAARQAEAVAHRPALKRSRAGVPVKVRPQPPGVFGPDGKSTCSTNAACDCLCHDEFFRGPQSAQERKKWSIVLQNKATTTHTYVRSRRTTVPGARRTIISFMAKASSPSPAPAIGALSSAPGPDPCCLGPSCACLCRRASRCACA
jgi:hypothetical protein